MFDKGDRVLTPSGRGTIYYKRMRAPDYSKVESYSVKLDKMMTSTNHNFETYNGTIFPAEEVQELI